MSVDVCWPQEGLIGKVLSLLDEIDEQRILEKLQGGRGVGDDTHRRQLCAMISEQRVLLAEIVYCCSCQVALNRADTLKLIDYLRRCHCVTSRGTLDGVSVALIMALLYTLSIDHHDEDDLILESPSWTATMPLAHDGRYLPDIQQQIIGPGEWAEDGLHAVVMLAWSLLKIGRAHV